MLAMKQITMALSFALVLGLVGCGSDDGDNGGGSGAAAKQACNAYCDGTASCTDFAYTDAAECKSDECGGLEQTKGACASAFKAYYDCVNAKADKCDETGCTLDLDACI